MKISLVYGQNFFICWQMYLFLCMLETLYLHRKHISGCCAKTTRQNSRRLVEEFTESIASTLDSPVLFFFFEKILLRDVIYLRSSSRTRVNSYKYPKRAATESLWQGKTGGRKREQHRQKWREALETFKAIPGVWRRGRWPIARGIDPQFNYRSKSQSGVV